jgi:hypothetical protein
MVLSYIQYLRQFHCIQTATPINYLKYFSAVKLSFSSVITATLHAIKNTELFCCVSQIVGALCKPSMPIGRRGCD